MSRYQDYLNSREWKARREWALERADRRCQVCNGAGVLDVHHRTYERLGAELPSDLIVLCRDCHSLFHKNGRMPVESSGDMELGWLRLLVWFPEFGQSFSDGDIAGPDPFSTHARAELFSALVESERAKNAHLSADASVLLMVLLAEWHDDDLRKEVLLGALRDFGPWEEMASAIEGGDAGVISRVIQSNDSKAKKFQARSLQRIFELGPPRPEYIFGANQ